jgi:hypothetical protein
MDKENIDDIKCKIWPIDMFDFSNIYFNEKTGQIGTPCKFISKEEALKLYPEKINVQKEST